jgi:methylmalonyl-CoA carboxyltransferase large subunit
MNEAVPQPSSDSEALRATLQGVVAQLATLSERVAGLEKLVSAVEQEPTQAAKAEVVKPSVSETPTTDSVTAAAGISEEEFLAVSAAIAAWLGVHAHIRQIRLIRTGAWAQQGRVTIQTSHRLNY